MTRRLHVDPSGGLTLAGLIEGLTRLGATARPAPPALREAAFGRLRDAGIALEVREAEELDRALGLFAALDGAACTSGPIPLPADGLPFPSQLLEGAWAAGVPAGVPVEAAAAALLLATARFSPAPSMRLEKSADAGVRLYLGFDEAERGAERLLLLAANLDDLSPEVTALLPGLCLDAGALDAWLTPALMKKGRPGHVATALVTEQAAAVVEETLFRHSSTLGVRRHEVGRAALARDWLTVETGFGPVRVKRGRLGGETVNLAPEFEECAALAKKTGAPVKEIMARALACALESEESAAD